MAIEFPHGLTSPAPPQRPVSRGKLFRQPTASPLQELYEFGQHGSSSSISYCDDLNYCAVETVESYNKELLIVVTVVGMLLEPCLSEIFSQKSSGPSFRVQGCASSENALAFPVHFKSESSEVFIFFKLPDGLQLSQDISFRYAPGYTPVSIVGRLTGLFQRNEPMKENVQQQSLGECWQDCMESPSKPYTNSKNHLQTSPYRIAWEEDCVERPISNLCHNQETNASNFTRGRCVSPAASSYRNRSGSATPVRSVSRTVCSPVSFEERRKREDGFIQKGSPKPQRREASQAPTPSGASCAHLFATIEAQNHPQGLQQHLQIVQEIRQLWISGDSLLLSRLEAPSGLRDVILFRLFSSLSQQSHPLPPRVFSRLLFLAQQLAQSSYEDRAVVAMRFVLQSLKVSWPSVAKSLQNVATPKASFEACEEVVSRMLSLYGLVKAMSRSVRISRTNGQLVPVCRKLKSSLEEVLTVAGRLRGN